MDRKVKLISAEIGSLLEEQAAHELKNFTLYSSFANFFELEGITDLGTYYYKRAEEEKHHHDWIAKFLADGDCRLHYAAITANKEQEVNSIIDPFIATVAREIETTQMLYRIYDKAISERDYMTASWLFEKLIKEQIEEENTSRMAKVIMEMDGDIFIKAERILDLLEG